MSQHLVRRMSMLALWLASACSSDLPERATFVEPLYVDVCDAFDCSGLGECLSSDAGEPYCECITGYAGAQCEACAEAFHRDAGWRCVPDKRCKDEAQDVCGDHGDCRDDTGVIQCDCDTGYAGARCSLCATGYARKSELCLKGTPK